MLKSSSVVLACSLLAPASTAGATLTGADRLSAAYDLILSAQFDRADAALKTTCPPAPAEACNVLAVVSVWWRIQLDPDNRSRDELLNDRARTSA